MPLMILGAGGLAREVASLAQSMGLKVCAFWGQGADQRKSHLNGIEVICSKGALPSCKTVQVLAAIGNPLNKFRAIQEAKSAGFFFTSLIHPSLFIDAKHISWGEGCIFFPGVFLTTNIKIGSHVCIYPGSTLGHDCLVDDYCTLAPGVHLAGHTHLEEKVFMGTGSVTKENIRIGKESLVGAGAVVIDDFPSKSKAVGCPARQV